jgi:hypothetical protein
VENLKKEIMNLAVQNRQDVIIPECRFASMDEIVTVHIVPKIPKDLLDPVLYSTCTISMSFSLECEKAHVYGCSTPVILLNNIEQVMEFPWEAILRCTEPGAGPPNAQADGECCFLALWHPVIIPM